MAEISGPEPLTTIEALLQPASVIHAETVDSAPGCKGAYVLAIRLGAPVDFVRGRTGYALGAGWFAYSGSAYGPGGIRARLRRHFQSDKKLHWHVDHLTPVAQHIQAVALEGGSECELVARLIHSGTFEPAAEGFGSSDCNTCRSHLLRWRPNAHNCCVI